MNSRFYIFWAILLLTCGYAIWRGRTDERIVAAVCLAATVLTRFAVSPLKDRYASVETGLMLIDVLALLIFIWIALKSQRFWPLWVAGLQLVISVSHIFKYADLALMPRAYAAAVALWSYPILLILVIGTFRGRHHRGDAHRLSLT